MSTALYRHAYRTVEAWLFPLSTDLAPLAVRRAHAILIQLQYRLVPAVQQVTAVQQQGTAAQQGTTVEPVECDTAGHGSTLGHSSTANSVGYCRMQRSGAQQYSQ